MIGKLVGGALVVGSGLTAAGVYTYNTYIAPQVAEFDITDLNGVQGLGQLALEKGLEIGKDQFTVENCVGATFMIEQANGGQVLVAETDYGRANINLADVRSFCDNIPAAQAAVEAAQQ